MSQPPLPEDSFPRENWTADVLDAENGTTYPEAEPQITDEEAPVKDIDDSANTSRENSGANGRSKAMTALVILLCIAALAGIIVGLTLGLGGENKSSSADAAASSGSSGDQQRESPDLDELSSSVPEATTGFDASDKSKWPHEISDIPPDPRIQFGSLPNGVRYMVMSNDSPPEKLSLRLHVHAGSMNEDDDQRGLAHFVEHMVFVGTKNFPEVPELIQELQRLGLYFGVHSNAYTDFMETAYDLDLPNVDNETVTTGFAVLRDYADGALFPPEKLEVERGVVLAEERGFVSAETIVELEQWDLLLPDHRLPKRDPGGDMDVVRTAPRQRFLDFYRQHYVPERITVIVVGDLPAVELELWIEEAFGSMVQPEDAKPDPDFGSLPPVGKGLQAAVYRDEEIVDDTIWLTTVSELESKADTRQDRIKEVPLIIANEILSRRFSDLADDEGSPIRDGFAYQDDVYNLFDWGSIDITCKEGQWPAAVGLVEQELRRAIDHGFTTSEIAEIKENLKFAYEQAAATYKTYGSSDIAWDLVDTIQPRKVYSTPETDLSIMQSALEEAGIAEVNQAFKDYWDTDDFTLFLTTKEEEDVTSEQLKRLFLLSRATVTVEPIAEDEEDEGFAYTGFGPPGTVVSDNIIEDLEFRQMVLSNNVRVNFKQTGFDEGYVSVVARFGTGSLEQPRRPWLDLFAETVVDLGGLGKHTQDDIDEIFADNSVFASFWVNEDSFDFGADVLAEDLEPQLQLMAAHMIDQGYREEAVRLFQAEVPSIMNELTRRFEGTLYSVDEWVHGGDERFSVPTRDDLMSYQLSDAKDWLQDYFTKSSIELTIVGDFDPDTALPLILHTFGALPVREEFPVEVGAEERALTFPPKPSYRAFTYRSRSKRSAAIAAFEIPSVKESITPFRRIELLVEVYSNRLFERIREELGNSYSPYASAAPSLVFDHGFIWAESDIAPDVMETTGKLLLDIAESCTQITDDEFLRAKEPLLTLVEETLVDNNYWTYEVLWESQQKPYVLDWARRRNEDYTSVTREEVEKLAETYLVPSNSLRMDVLPVAPGDAGESADPEVGEGSNTRDLQSAMKSLLHDRPYTFGSRYINKKSNRRNSWQL